MKRKNWLTLIIIFVVILLSTIILIKPASKTSEEVVKCIGKNSKLYVQLGCNACKKQEEIFGENKKYLEIIDCWFERDKCSKITHIPTWVINEKEYVGLQSIEKLKELTGC